MTPEKILELAQKCGTSETTARPTFYLHDGSPTGETYPQIDWKFGQEDLIAFAHAIIETEREISGECKKLMAYKALVESLEARIASHESNRLRYQEARDTLESERECNARLTEELSDRESSDEPVAWMNRDGYLTQYRQGDAIIPLYRHPSPARKMTDEEILEVAAQHPPVYPWMLEEDMTLGDLRKMTISFSRAIECRIIGEED